MSARAKLKRDNLFEQLSGAHPQQEQSSTVLESLNDFVPRLNDMWTMSTALVLEDSVTLAAKLLMNSERETMV